MKDEILAFNFTVAEADIIINALDERVSVISDLRQKIYDSATQQVKSIQTARALMAVHNEETEEPKEEADEE